MTMQSCEQLTLQSTNCNFFAAVDLTVPEELAHLVPAGRSQAWCRTCIAFPSFHSALTFTKDQDTCSKMSQGVSDLACRDIYCNTIRHRNVTISG